MDISSLSTLISNVDNSASTSKMYQNLSSQDIASLYAAQNEALSSVAGAAEGSDFSSILDSMVNALDETNTLQNKAEEAEIQFALGYSDNTHDLLIAQTKANVALQYTVAVRDRMIESYQQIMQMQI